MGQTAAWRACSDIALIRLMAYCFNPDCPQPQNVANVQFCQTCGSALTLADRYQSVSLLGQSGLGRTLLAKVKRENNSLNDCVIKQIYRSKTAEEIRFKDEARRLRQLGKHPQIPQLLEAIENELGQFLVHEFVPGENLEQQMEKTGTWDEKGVRSLLKSLIPVLQYVHSFKVIHRDIKPVNIIQTSQNSPMLVDVGAAKWVGRTAAKTVIGSAGYAAPEQSMGEAVFASDVYSLGLTCLHLLTGMHPFELHSATEDRWVWQDYLTVPVTAEFAQMLDKMVARSLQVRYQTMDDVAVALKAVERSQLSGAGQLIARAKESVAPWQNVLSGDASLFQRGKASADSVRKSIAPAQSNRSPVIVDPQRWELRHRITKPIGLTQAITVSPGVPIFATGGSDGAIRLWRLEEGELIYTFARKRFVGEGHTAAITDVQFHPDGRAFYSASSDGSVKEWDSQECQFMNTLSGAGWTPTALAMSPDGTELMSANSDGRIVVWDIATLTPTAQLAQHQQSVNAIAIAPSGDLLVSAGEDGTVKLWQYQSGETPQLAKTIRVEAQGAMNIAKFGSFADAKSGVVAIALQPQTQRSKQKLVVATSNAVRRYELTSPFDMGEPVEIYRSSSLVNAIALSSNGTLAVGTEDRVLRLWDLSIDECVAALKHEWGVSAIAFSPDGQTLIIASADETLSIWQIA